MSRYINKASSPDYLFISLLFFLVIFGLVMLSSASSEKAQDQFGNSYYYVNHQIVYGLSIGLVGFLVGALVYYRFWEKFALPLLLLSLALVLLVFTPLGLNIKGGERWVAVGPVSFQPSELLKLSFFIYLGTWIGRSQSRSQSFGNGLIPFLFLVGGVMLVLLLQPSTTTAALIFTASILTYFTAGARLRFLVVAVLIAALAFSLLVYITPYRLTRVISFLNPSVDELGTSYHINQAQTAIGSGGIFGVGFGKSTTKLNSLPEPIGDSIFAVIAEELGFVGGILLIFIFLFFVWRGLAIARAAPDTFGRLIVTGFMSIIGLQAFVHIAAISGVTPLTGVPLPFISYGGTSLATFLMMSGIVVNISRYRVGRR
ncbi:cell division protein FtsW [Candidatus Jorgensenbacteria bacterium]|nr:cell division protein FtsW [Candidatus Jorgensenbacteria bacterium]